MDKPITTIKDHFMNKTLKGILRYLLPWGLLLTRFPPTPDRSLLMARFIIVIKVFAIFKLIKGFKYDFIVSEELGQDVYSIDVPADKFEDGVTYSWYVEQRDASKNIWSRHDTVWSFKVIKK